MITQALQYLWVSRWIKTQGLKRLEENKKGWGNSIKKFCTNPEHCKPGSSDSNVNVFICQICNLPYASFETLQHEVNEMAY